MERPFSAHVHVVAAAYLGWTFDAFHFFIMVFVLGNIAQSFGTDVTAVTWAITLTLAMRALGAWIFGRLADRYGRRPMRPSRARSPHGSAATMPCLWR